VKKKNAALYLYDACDREVTKRAAEWTDLP